MTNYPTVIDIDLKKADHAIVLNKSDSVNNGQTQVIFSYTPTVYLVRVSGEGDKGPEIEFLSQDIAERVANAINHAIELCGGGLKEPF